MVQTMQGLEKNPNLDEAYMTQFKSNLDHAELN
jgi:hypothetical protein